MEKLIEDLRNMLVKSNLYTYKELDKMPDIAIQAKFQEHFETVETMNILEKDIEVYYIPKTFLRGLMAKNKAFKEVKGQCEVNKLKELKKEYKILKAEIDNLEEKEETIKKEISDKYKKYRNKAIEIAKFSIYKRI
ncbi:MAG: hypothetical protein LBV03_07435 [Fusobacteriales bacterium]|jgi:cell division protein FtsB|nr:hypothetical protein [Fusobacteriales bacterium]